MDIANFRVVNVDRFIAFENEDMTPEEILVFFQDMIDTCIVWKLQGRYARIARDLIKAGYCYDTE